jgi:hypothetical protein
MASSNTSILNKYTIERLFDLPSLSLSVEAACEVAARHPKTLYIFIQRYVHFNRCTGSLLGHLARSIGLSRDLFNDPDCHVIGAVDRSIEIASKIIAANIDEYADRGARYVPHRTFAQATLQTVGNYAKLTQLEQNKLAIVPYWMKEILEDTVNGYQGVPGNATGLIRSMGFHAASEVLAAREYLSIDKVIRYDNRGKGFDAYLRNLDRNFTVEDRQFTACYWSVIHSKHQGARVEAEHFECALEAIDLATKYRPESAQEIRKSALQGFSDFVIVQQRLFAEIARECAEIQVLELV